MQIEIEYPENCTAFVNVFLPKETVKEVYDLAYSEFSRYVNVPGFRPGKAPRPLLQKFIDPVKLRQFVVDKLIDDSATEALLQSKLTPFRSPSITQNDIEEGEDYSYQIEVPLEPKIVLGTYMGLTTTQTRFVPTAEYVQDEKNRLLYDYQKKNTKHERIAHRGVQSNDTLIVENLVIVDGKPLVENSRRQTYDYGMDMFPGYDDEILGMVLGEERTFKTVISFSETKQAENDKDTETVTVEKEAEITVRLHAIMAYPELELNDDTAQKVFSVNTVEEIEPSIYENILKITQRLADEYAEQDLILQILETSQVDFPRRMILDEMTHKVNQKTDELKAINLTYDEYLKSLEETRDEHLNKLSKNVYRQVAALLVLHQIALTENISVTDEEIDAEIDKFVAEESIDLDYADEYRQSEEGRMELANAIIQTKLHKFLFENNNVQYVEQDYDANATAQIEEAQDSERLEEELQNPS